MPKKEGMVDHVKKMSSHLFFIAMHNLVAVSHAVCAHVAGPKNFEHAGTPPQLGWGLVGLFDLETHPSPTSVTNANLVVLGHMDGA